MNGMVWVRVLVGALWLNGGIEKLLNPDFPRQFADTLEVGGFVSQAPPFFRDFMQGTVVPNAELFAQLVRAGELTVGVALSILILLSGGGVRLGTGLGAPEFITINVLVALISLVILFSPAAKEVSLDSGLARRSPGLSPVLTNRRRRA